MAEGSRINGEMYVADGDYIKDIEVNDLRNRYTLTKGSTQKMVNNSWSIPTDSLSILLALGCVADKLVSHP